MVLVKLALKTIVSRKRLSLALILLASISSFLLVFGNSLTNTMILKTEEKAYQKYGEFHAVINDIKSEDLKKLQNAKAVKKIGHIQNLGRTESFHDSNLPANYGVLDQNAVELGHIQLESGRFPQHKDEIVIESFLKHAFSKNALKSYVNLEVNGKEEKYKIVGIIKNYSSVWTPPKVDEARNINYPNVLFHKDSIHLKKNKKNVLVQLTKTVDENAVYEILTDITNNEWLTSNENLLEAKTQYLDSFQILKFLFNAILLSLSIACVMYLFHVFFRDHTKKIGIFRAIGLDKKQTLLMLLFQKFLLLGLSSIVFIIFLSTYILIINLFKIEYDINISIFMLFILILIVIIIWTSFKQVKQIFSKDIISNLNNNNRRLKTSKNIINEKFYSKISYPFKILFHNLVLKWKTNALLVITIGLFITVFYTTYLIVEETKPKDLKTQPDFSLFSKRSISYHIINNHMLEIGESKGFSFKNVDNFEKSKGIKYIEKYPNTKDSGLFVENGKVSKYLKNWTDNNLDDSHSNQLEENSYERYIPENTTYIPNVKFFVVNNQEFGQLKRQYNLESNNHDDSALLFFPEMNGLSEDTLNKDENIYIGRVEQDSKGKLNYKKWKINIGDLVDEPYRLQMNGIVVENDGLTVVIPQKLAIEKKLFNGYEELYIYLYDHVTSSIQHQIETKSREMVGPFQGGYFASKSEETKQQQELADYTMKLGQTLSFSILIILFILLVTMLYGKLVERQSAYSIQIALGKRRFILFLELVYEMLFYFVCSILLGTVIITVMNQLQSTEMSIQQQITLAVQGISVVAVFLFIIVGSSYFYIRRLKIAKGLFTEES
ncbi:ABC transporter permease [Bacillus pumilus]|uniref:ABC transporter permease n=1 Tax=Bacillus pumilus TaxID=1408 RepID=UPI001C221BDD|nr:ABC transporter permease [Bacillus pumilus]MBU8638052.1 ABC transporter permease [Bacillus pumilus]